jgi:hypothetical protein
LVALEQPIASETAKGVEASLSLVAVVFDGARCNFLLHQCEGSVLEALSGQVHTVGAAEEQGERRRTHAILKRRAHGRGVLGG